MLAIIMHTACTHHSTPPPLVAFPHTTLHTHLPPSPPSMHSHPTEDLALRFGNIVGGLCNATFGNVVELLLSIAALSKGLYSVVAMSLIGSILSNLLLVLGMSVGGMRGDVCV